MTWEIRDRGWPIPYSTIRDWPTFTKESWPIPKGESWPIPEKQLYSYYGNSIYLTESNKGHIINIWV